MRKHFIYVTSPICAAIIVAGAWLTNAGDLNPPAGPVTPTMLTLDDLASAIQSIPGGDVRTDVLTLPGSASALHVIDQPGSYYVSGNITGVSGKMGIEIAASGVTLDLNGFELIGVPGSLDGVGAPSTTESIVLHNGTLCNWGQAGVNLENTTGGRLTDIHVRSNASYGIKVRDGFIITDCSAHANDSDGIRTRWRCTITNCTSNSNTNGTGIWTEVYNTITACTANHNGVRGIQGITSVIQDCSASQNGAFGFFATDGSTITQCSAWSNTGDGFLVGPWTTISGCTAVANDGNGIRSQGYSLILNNVCTRNDEPGMAGIRLEHHDRAEANHVTSNAIGIRADVDDNNIIIKNSADGNTTNYSIASGNHSGQIVISPGVGFSNGTPWANFEFP